MPSRRGSCFQPTTTNEPKDDAAAADAVADAGDAPPFESSTAAPGFESGSADGDDDAGAHTGWPTDIDSGTIPALMRDSVLALMLTTAMRVAPTVPNCSPHCSRTSNCLPLIASLSFSLAASASDLALSGAGVL